MKIVNCKIKNSLKAFTLLEVLLSITIIGIIAALSIPTARTFLITNDLDISANSVASSFRRASALSQGVQGDSQWGVRVNTGSIVVFKGTVYAARDPNYDETFDIASSITPSGLTEVIFAKLTGLPQSTGTTTLTSSLNSVRNVNINGKGRVQY